MIFACIIGGPSVVKLYREWTPIEHKYHLRTLSSPGAISDTDDGILSHRPSRSRSKSHGIARESLGVYYREALDMQ